MNTIDRDYKIQIKSIRKMIAAGMSKHDIAYVVSSLLGCTGRQAYDLYDLAATTEPAGR